MSTINTKVMLAVAEGVGLPKFEDGDPDPDDLLDAVAEVLVEWAQGEFAGFREGVAAVIISAASAGRYLT